MDAGRPHTLTGSRAIPRQIIQGRNSPGKPSSKTAGVAGAGQSGRKDHAPVKASSKRHATHQQASVTPGLTAGHSLTRPVQQHRQSGQSSRSALSPTVHSPSTTRQSKNTALQPLSRLESLPTEILEQIFFYTLELSIGCSFLNLPRASLSIGRKLWSSFVREGLFRRMCSDPQPVKQHKDFDAEHAKTQSWILRQPWLDYAFILHCIPDYMASVLVDELSNHKLHWLDHTGPLVNLEFRPELCHYITHHYEQHLLSRVSPPVSPDVQYIEHQWVEQDYPMRHVILGLSPASGFMKLQIQEADRSLVVGVDGLENPPFYARWRIVSLKSATQIPSHLLRGPWELDKIELLELLIRGGATVDWIHTTAGEVAESGFFDAMRDNNARALRALCICKNDSYPGERKDATYTTVPSRGVGVTPEQKHLLFALDHGCDAEIVNILLNAPESECDLQAEEVTQAKYQMESRGWLVYASWLAEKRELDKDRKRLETGRQIRGKNGGWLKGPPDLRARAFSPF